MVPNKVIIQFHCDGNDIADTVRLEIASCMKSLASKHNIAGISVEGRFDSILNSLRVSAEELNAGSMVAAATNEITNCPTELEAYL